MSKNRRISRLGFPWKTHDPFLFCAHHLDLYPQGNEDLTPQSDLRGRRIGMDFSGKDGWSMYHGECIPGFPQHPHRGFETLTIVRRGHIDHADSMGATARFGMGDVQWMTAGKGVVHSEMFPLLHQERENPTEIFQIWLNLPRASKFVDPYFTMFWADSIPQVVDVDTTGRSTYLSIIAGSYKGTTAPTPPPNSWAREPDADIAIWTLQMEPGASWNAPQVQTDTHRCLYVFEGASVSINGQDVPTGYMCSIRDGEALTVLNGEETAELLLLQGRPIGEPIAQQGPFVMNTEAEVYQAYIDFQETGFGGWPWADDAPTHPREQKRFAQHADGRIEYADEPVS